MPFLFVFVGHEMKVDGLTRLRVILALKIHPTAQKRIGL